MDHKDFRVIVHMDVDFLRNDESYSNSILGAPQALARTISSQVQNQIDSLNERLAFLVGAATLAAIASRIETYLQVSDRISSSVDSYMLRQVLD